MSQGLVSVHTTSRHPRRPGSPRLSECRSTKAFAPGIALNLHRTLDNDPIRVLISDLLFPATECLSVSVPTKRFCRKHVLTWYLRFRGLGEVPLHRPMRLRSLRFGHTPQRSIRLPNQLTPWPSRSIDAGTPCRQGRPKAVSNPVAWASEPNRSAWSRNGDGEI